MAIRSLAGTRCGTQSGHLRWIWRGLPSTLDSSYPNPRPSLPTKWRGVSRSFDNRRSLKCLINIKPIRNNSLEWFYKDIFAYVIFYFRPPGVGVSPTFSHNGGTWAQGLRQSVGVAHSDWKGQIGRRENAPREWEATFRRHVRSIVHDCQQKMQIFPSAKQEERISDIWW